MPYTFQSVKSMAKLTDSSKLYNFIENFSDYENQFSLICGKIKALFGQPIYETENLENLFSYCILATSKEVDLCQYFGHKKLKVYAAFLNSSSSFCCGII